MPPSRVQGHAQTMGDDTIPHGRSCLLRHASALRAGGVDVSPRDPPPRLDQGRELLARWIELILALIGASMRGCRTTVRGEAEHARGQDDGRWLSLGRGNELTSFQCQLYLYH